MPRKYKYYIVILNYNKKSNLDLGAQIILLNKCIQKFLSMINTERKILSSIKKFLLP